MKKYSILFIAVLYCLSECNAECSDYYVVLQRTNLETYELADTNHIADVFSHPYNISKEHQELRENKDCILTKDVRVNECYNSEPVCNSPTKHDKEKSSYTVRTELTGVNISIPNDNQKNEIKSDDVSNADKIGMVPNTDEGVDSKKRAIIMTSVGVSSGVLLVATKLILNFLQKGAYYLPEPNTSV